MLSYKQDALSKILTIVLFHIWRSLYDRDGQYYIINDLKFVLLPLVKFKWIGLEKKFEENSFSQSKECSNQDKVLWIYYIKTFEV